MPRPLAPALLLALLPGTAAAQPQAGQAQPDRLALGTLYVGATAEASFMVFEPGTDPKVELKVDAPKFVRVLKTGTHHQQFGPGNDFVCGTVELALDTAAAGDLKGDIAVTLGKTTAKVPVAAAVKARRPGLRRVLVAGTPFEKYATGDGTVFAAWTALAADAGLDPSYLLIRDKVAVLRDVDLSKFDCVLLSAEALVRQTPADVMRARAYAAAGGRVVVTANAFFVGSVKGANAVLDGSGLQVRDEEARTAEGMDVTLEQEGFAPEVARTGVKSARFYRASPVAVADPKTGRVLARAFGTGQAGDGFAASARVGKGEVVALGVSLWWNWVSKEQAKGTDNARLLRWLLAPVAPL